MATDDITESQQDNEVNSYLQSHDKELDPLTILKQKDEEDKQKEDFFDVSCIIWLRNCANISISLKKFEQVAKSLLAGLNVILNPQNANKMYAFSNEG